MPKVNALLFASLDGFASDRAEELRWISENFGDEQAAYVLEQHRSWGMLALGRVTYQLLASYWPSASPERDGEFVELMNSIPKTVFSGTLQPRDVRWNNARLNSGDAVSEIKELKRRADGDIGIVGSVRLVRSLMRYGLIDRLALQVFPVLLGTDGGKPIFDRHDRGELRLIDTRALDGEVVALDYEPA